MEFTISSEPHSAKLARRHDFRDLPFAALAESVEGSSFFVPNFRAGNGASLRVRAACKSKEYGFFVSVRKTDEGYYIINRGKRDAK
ncbi:MAG: hypothetical protein ACTHKB_15720 [Burkholderiaceae bacterium]